MNPLWRLQDFGQSVWYGDFHRAMLGKGGELERMIREDGLRGLSANLTSFEKGINQNGVYDEALQQLARQYPDSHSRELFFALAIEEVQKAADQFIQIYTVTQGYDGYVSLDISPDLAYNTEATYAEAIQLSERINRPNVMIKIPATREAIPAIEALTAAGINVNATLIFSIDRYKEVAQAYINGLRQRLQQGLAIDRISSVASFFISRVDALVDTLLTEKAYRATEEIRTLVDETKGSIAIANAACAYKASRIIFCKEFGELEQAGARPQRLLWANTGSKNPEYSDLLYIHSLIAPNTINALPGASYQAFKDHGDPRIPLDEGIASATLALNRLDRLDINLASITQQLEDDGIWACNHAFQSLLATIETKTSRYRQAA